MRSLINWDPFQELVPRLFGDADQTAFLPAFDVRETKDAYEFTADVPGLHEQDVDINIAGNRLTIAGKRETEQVDESDTYYCAERSYGTFSRSFTLPRDVDADAADADIRDGVLKVHVPKAAQAQAKRISVKAGSTGTEPSGGTSAEQSQKPGKK
jgi:HSP20 family protein